MPFETILQIATGTAVDPGTIMLIVVGIIIAAIIVLSILLTFIPL